MPNVVCIAGAGPAGLTAAYELIKAGIKPVVIEADTQVGGIAKTVVYKGNRMDIGGHRFFTKSQQVIDFWKNILPYEDETYLPSEYDKIMMVRNRLSRILFLSKFYSYPISLSLETLCNLGVFRTLKIGGSYLAAMAFPIKEEKSLADFFTNRFGKELYATFFRDYTEKVWGVSCDDIPSDWGAQRVKGLSVAEAIFHAFKCILQVKNARVETSLIEQFHYPKYGPGFLWEEVAQRIIEAGGSIQLEKKVTGVLTSGHSITDVIIEDKYGEKQQLAVDAFFSSMPVKELIPMLPDVPMELRRIADGLPYRDFITVGVLLQKEKTESLPDNWIYVQEPHLKMGRIQIFNNWSPYMVANEDTLWLGLEYFCQENDIFWNMSDEEMIQLAVDELNSIGFILDSSAVLDSVVLRVKKAYPAYFGTYAQFNQLQSFLLNFANLYAIGRNGQHHYNNMDHSILTAMRAVEVLTGKNADKKAVWQVNIEEAYHETK